LRLEVFRLQAEVVDEYRVEEFNPRVGDRLESAQYPEGYF
jgi:hypothetical protein